MDEKDKKIARLEELLQSIKDNIDETESVLDSLSNSELQAENDNDLPDDEFDRLLDEFIQSQLSEEETEDEEESDNSPSNTSHHIIFKNTFFSICDTKEQIPRDSLRTQFSVDEGEYLFISTECIGQNESATIDTWDETFLAELIAPDGSSYIETQIPCRSTPKTTPVHRHISLFLKEKTEKAHGFTAYPDSPTKKNIQPKVRLLYLCPKNTTNVSR